MNRTEAVALWGAILMLIAVIIGAFGAHALATVLQQNDRVEVFETANRYHFYHGIALLLVSMLSRVWANLQNIALVSRLLIAGTLLFSGSLYVLAIFNLPQIAWITPIGGFLLIFGWLVLIRDLYRNTRIR